MGYQVFGDISVGVVVVIGGSVNEGGVSSGVVITVFNITAVVTR